MPEFSIYHPKTGKTRSTKAKDEQHAIEICGWKAADVEVSILSGKRSGSRKSVTKSGSMINYLRANI